MPRWLGFIGPWGAPPDGPAWGAVACAVVAVGIACAPRELASAFLKRVGSRTFVALCALAAAILSLGYVAFYLRGGRGSSMRRRTSSRGARSRRGTSRGASPSLRRAFAGGSWSRTKTRIEG